jgi:hypothetical protein
MINPFTPFQRNEPAPIASLADKEMVLSDSTGYQALRAFPTAKRVVLTMTARPDRHSTDEVLFLNPFHNCMDNARTGATTAFLIDYPTFGEDSEEVYKWKLRMSQKARDLTLPLAAKLCPETELAIALQPRHMGELEEYYEEIATPEVRTYGFPLRGSHPLNIAYALSFLHHRGILKVHMLGSSAPHRIMVLAAAAGLGMFDRITFDSLTWQGHYAGKRQFFDHETLRAMPRRDNKAGRIDEDGLIRLLLDEHGGDFNLFLGGLQLPDDATVKEWIGIYNIRVFQYFTDRMAGLARRGELVDFVKDSWLPPKRKNAVLNAIEMLHRSAKDGHDAAVAFYAKNAPQDASQAS